MSRSDFTPHAAVAKDKISKNPKNIFFIRVLYPAHPPKVKSSHTRPPNVTRVTLPATGTHQCPPPHTGPRANIVCVGGFRAPRKQSLRGWLFVGAGGCRAKRDGGWGNTSNKSRATSNQNGACAPFLYQFPHCNGCIAHAV